MQHVAAGMLTFRLMRVESLDASEKFASEKKTVAGDLNPNPFAPKSFCTQILLHPNHLGPNSLYFYSRQTQPDNMARGKKRSPDDEQMDLGMRTLKAWDVSVVVCA